MRVNKSANLELLALITALFYSNFDLASAVSLILFDKPNVGQPETNILIQTQQSSFEQQLSA